MVLIFGWYFKHLGLNYTERLNTHKEEQVHIYIYGTMVIAFKIFMYFFADKKVFLKCGRNKIVETYSRVTEKSPVIILKVGLWKNNTFVFKTFRCIAFYSKGNYFVMLMVSKNPTKTKTHE